MIYGVILIAGFLIAGILSEWYLTTSAKCFPSQHSEREATNILWNYKTTWGCGVAISKRILLTIALAFPAWVYVSDVYSWNVAKICLGAMIINLIVGKVCEELDHRSYMNGN